MIEFIILLLCLLSIIISIICLGFSIYACIELSAFKKSTHQIQYVPVSHKDEKEVEEFLKKELNEDEDELLGTEE